jgi:hypothetical protein
LNRRTLVTQSPDLQFLDEQDVNQSVKQTIGYFSAGLGPFPLMIISYGIGF